jgi:two-component system sensor histidine kinase YesM
LICGGNIKMNFLKKMHIKKQLSILTVFTVAIMTLIFFLTYFLVAGVISKNSVEYMKNMSFQVKQAISSNCDLSNRILTSIAYDGNIQDYMMEVDPIKKIEIFKKVKSFLENMQDMKAGIIDIVILGDNGNSYYHKGKTELTEKAVKSLSGRLINYYTGNEQMEYSGINRNCFIAASSVYSIDPYKASGKKIGIVALVLDVDTLSPDVKDMPLTSVTKFYLLDRNNNVYSSNDSLKINQAFDIANSYEKYQDINGSKCIVTVDNITEIEGKIISVVPEKELFSDLSHIRMLVMIIFIGTLALLSFPLILITNNILQPIKRFMEFMSAIKSGNLKGLQNRIYVEGYAEMCIMACEFNSMLDEIDSLTHRLVSTSSRLYESEIEKKQSELAFLQSQINPHFLYNTLESIVGIAAVEGNYRIMEIAKSLGEIFHYSVKGNDEVTVEEELDIVKSYVKIQQIRFSDRFVVDFSFSQDILACRILKMLLQPIVENSIYHGLEPKLGKGHLWISAAFYDECLLISIRDDGMGIDSDTFNSISSALEDKIRSYTFKGTYRTGLGIINVNNRIKLIYGEQYGIVVNSTPGYETNVTLKIPIRR